MSLRVLNIPFRGGVLRSCTEVNEPLPPCESTPLQLKVLHLKSYPCKYQSIKSKSTHCSGKSVCVTDELWSYESDHAVTAEAEFSAFHHISYGYHSLETGIKVQHSIQWSRSKKYKYLETVLHYFAPLDLNELFFGHHQDICLHEWNNPQGALSALQTFRFLFYGLMCFWLLSEDLRSL